jgi:hypothetical protein
MNESHPKQINIGRCKSQNNLKFVSALRPWYLGNHHSDEDFQTITWKNSSKSCALTKRSPSGRQEGDFERKLVSHIRGGTKLSVLPLKMIWSMKFRPREVSCLRMSGTEIESEENAKVFGDITTWRWKFNRHSFISTFSSFRQQSFQVRGGSAFVGESPLMRMFLRMRDDRTGERIGKVIREVEGCRWSGYSNKQDWTQNMTRNWTEEFVTRFLVRRPR